MPVFTNLEAVALSSDRISYDTIYCGPPIEWVVVDQSHILLVVLFIPFIDYDFRLQCQD
ncbi:hypothetical protein B0H14DRAFT_3519205 [Mycena olivaceomarginata]|nr:hypothetical protein B0H14DRAFT_3519205 [Mycena olivaceomarginata]